MCVRMEMRLSVPLVYIPLAAIVAYSNIVLARQRGLPPVEIACRELAYLVVGR